MSETRAPCRPYSSGLDVLRLAAMMLVTTQHVASNLGHDRWTDAGPFNLGQLGVALFLAVSGVLAVQGTTRPTRWLARRLMRVYPAYWLALAVSFALAWISGYKPFGWWQVGSQMLGTGLFTHSRTLVNTPTWFVSVLLVCYLWIFFMRASHIPRALSLASVVACVLWLQSLGWAWPAYHLLTFCSAATAAALAPTRPSAGLINVGGAALVGTVWVPNLRYCATACLLAAGAMAFRERRLRFVTPLVEFSYEYYLVHGICVAGAIRLMRTVPVVAVFVGIASAVVGAVALRAAADALTHGCWATVRHNRVSGEACWPSDRAGWLAEAARFLATGRNEP